MRDTFVGLAFLALGLFALFWLIPAGISVPRHLPSIALSPALWPSIVAGFIAVTGAVLALQNWRKMRGNRAQPSSHEGSASESTPFFGANILKTILAALLLIPYYIACERVGLLMPSIVAFGVFALLAGERRHLVALAWAIALPVALTWFFLHVANIVIPLGPLTGML